MRNFKEAVEAYELFEARGLENETTGWGSRESGIIKENLDRFLINEEWFLLYPNHVAFSLGFGGSDYAPIITCHNKKRVTRSPRRRIRFEELWTISEDFQNIVKEEWQKVPLQGSTQLLPQILKSCAKTF
ncbi:uncharacterized protein LOC126668537 [Mercurialis annua]|uniref:uncharacterized protein LOC126668537 n=1 Tax=Mercurialis annua TaxID=3986 RepID=UPI00215FEC0F|nr:uncharacterized protein LOC126668537 [Mercurialis annua]